jgi:magnesium-transporting ATPase (P-type)
VLQPHGGILERCPLLRQDADAIVAGTILGMAQRSLRTVGLAYRDFPSVEALPATWETGTAGIEEGLTFYGILGIKDPLRKVRSRRR